ncbi:MAG: glycosyltransferase, partial [Betaproteobacteria bacterium]|nr:glycosyltransferase [Betaproteobacteria bacterium]
MKILYHHRTMGAGAEGIHVRSIVDALRAAGHEVRVSALVGETAATPSVVPGSQRRWMGIRRFIPDACYELAEIAYNVVGRIKLERAIHEFHPDAIYDRYNTYSTAAVSAARAHHIPAILEVNAPMALERRDIEYLPLRLPRLARWFERRIFMAASHVLVVSSPLKRYLETEFRIPPDHITVVPNGADPAAFAPDISVRRRERDRLGLHGKFVIGFVGNARPWHGLELLVDALDRIKSAVPHAHLLIVGGGSSLPAIKRLVAARNLESHVTIAGEVPHAEVKA